MHVLVVRGTGAQRITMTSFDAFTLFFLVEFAVVFLKELALNHHKWGEGRWAGSASQSDKAGEYFQESLSVNEIY